MSARVRAVGDCQKLSNLNACQMVNPHGRSDGITGIQWGWVASLFLGSCLFHLKTYGFTDDHFDRISRAHQIAQYGELPFKDFFDPGYFLTLFSSAAAQVMAGSPLLGEAILNILAFSLGFSLTFVLLLQITRSLPLALLITGLAVTAGPRFYDYDKILFYPLGVFLCWRYIDRTSLLNLALLGLGTVSAFWFRYDNGIYIGCAGTVALLVIHGKSVVLLHRFGFYALTVVTLSLPCLVFLQFNGGVGQYIAQIVNYASREGARTDLFQFPELEIDSEAPLVVIASQPSYPIKVRWVAGVDETERSDLEERYALKNPLLDEGRTWEYRLENTSVQHVRRLIAEPRIEDTGLIDRGTATVPAAESVGAKVRSSLVTFLPVLRIRVWPGLFSAANATALFYYVCLFIPVLALMIVWLLLSRHASTHSVRREVARGLSLTTLCLLVDAFILRDPVGARIGAVAPALALLGTWTVVQALSSSLAVQLGNTANHVALKSVRVLFVSCLGLGVFLAVSDRVTLSPITPTSLRGTVLRLAAFPPSEDLLPRGGQAGLIRYARACTRPQDRLLATWFAPQLFTMAGRGFAGNGSVLWRTLVGDAISTAYC